MFDFNASVRKIYVPIESIDTYKSAEYWSEYAGMIEGYNFETGEVIPETPLRPANNEIWYTNGSTTEATIPYETYAFGANIRSNTYDAEKECWVIKVNGDVTKIGDDAFLYCHDLTSVTIPDSVTTIGISAFYRCSSLTSVTIPDSVTTIGNSAFHDCSGLTSVTIGNSVTSIGDDAFRNCSGLTSVTIGNSVATIGEYAFISCSSLTSVNIPDGVTTIDQFAFSDCSSLTSVTIPDSVTSIGSYAFYNCTSLTSVYITDIAAWCNISFRSPESNPLSYAENIYLNNELVTDLIIPDSVTSIGDGAFWNCDSLTSVTIPNSVNSIGYSAFDGCANLKIVWSKNLTPPTAIFSEDNIWNAFEGCHADLAISVPSQSYDAFKTAPGWSDYKSSIVDDGYILEDDYFEDLEDF